MSHQNRTDCWSKWRFVTCLVLLVASPLGAAAALASSSGDAADVVAAADSEHELVQVPDLKIVGWTVDDSLHGQR